jgi:hypothetical protein
MCSQQACIARLSTSCNNAVISSSCYKLVTHNLLTSCELQDDNKLLDQLVTSLLSSTTLYIASCQQAVKPLTTCQQAGNKQCEHILLTSCWNSIATSLLQVCYNLCVFTCVVFREIAFLRHVNRETAFFSLWNVIHIPPPFPTLFV